MCHFAALCNYWANLGQKHILAPSKTPIFSLARLRHALGACHFIIFGRGRGQKQFLFVCVILPHFAIKSEIKAKNTHAQPQKRQIFSRSTFYSFRTGGAAKNKPFYVHHFATFCDTGLNLGRKHILTASKTQNFSRARRRRALEACLFVFVGRGCGQKPARFVCVILPHFAIQG